MRIGIVAGEASGDHLGAGLIKALHRRVPDAGFEGICGPQMAAQGARSLYPMEQISIMGLDGLFGHLGAILRTRRELIKGFLATPPDVFVGIDVPDFNLTVEEKLRAAGIPTVHYVSPTVWAWRTHRVHKIRRAVDRMITLFPFEAAFYRRHRIPASCVGHPLADEIRADHDPRDARARLNLPDTGEIVSLLPGSRISEVARLADIFLGTARGIIRRREGIRFVAPMANREVHALFFARYTEAYADLPIEIVHGRARDAIAASDVALVASGTATLEAALLGTPLVVAYRVSPLTLAYVKLFSQVQHYCMVNHLLDEPVVPEFMQARATPDRLAEAVLTYLTEPDQVRDLKSKFSTMHQALRRGANDRAAEIVLEIADTRHASAG